MFTGIVEELGTVRARHGSGLARLEVSCARVLDGTGVGDSISVNGCCLTVTELLDGGFAADVMGETLARTALGALEPGDPVDLERALRADARLGGHLVQGHVDAVGRVLEVRPQERWTVLRCALPSTLAPYVAEKGSITVDGASLTVSAVDDGWFEVALVPHTLEVTVLGRRRPGDAVNLEVDVIAKYVQRLLASGVQSPYTVGRPVASTPADAPADDQEPRSVQ